MDRKMPIRNFNLSKVKLKSKAVAAKNLCHIWTGIYCWHLQGNSSKLLIFNSSPLSATYMHQWISLALVHIMACRLFGIKPLSIVMLGYYQLDRQKQTSVKFEFEFYHFHSRKCIWICCLPEWQPFCPGGDELIYNNNGPNGHFFYVCGDLMMRRGMQPIIMLPDGDLRVVLHLVPLWILTIWGSVHIEETVVRWRNQLRMKTSAT